VEFPALTPAAGTKVAVMVELRRRTAMLVVWEMPRALPAATMASLAAPPSLVAAYN
jgi:hypothetical protein